MSCGCSGGWRWRANSPPADAATARQSDWSPGLVAAILSEGTSRESNLGELALVQDHFDEAEKYFALTLDAIRNPREENIRTGVYVNLGLIAQQRGDFSKALDLLERALPMAEKFGDTGALAMEHLFEAAVYV